MVDIGECGSRGDAGLFGECHIGQMLEDGQLGIPPDSEVPGAPMKLPYLFVGDEAFPLVKNLMRPYPGSGLDAERRVLNYRLSRARRTIENTFGILANRWKILRQDIRASARTIDMIVWATALLHNYLRTLDEEDHSCFKYCSDNDVDRVGPNGELIPGIWRAELPGNLGILTEVSGGSRIYTGYAKSVLDAFKATFHSPEGCVPWQKKVLSADL
ncbi:hypothetical protein HPB49_003678 [Dermacentor silvarum]|uniref:Uncharacterized protein n=1 Tax=Dermacentor silvarum TaxID=543639 RepID=A0ACB8DU58_DERSI|nr:hypothetical protein HPB49_003678 [Dermacentor silvarum]